MSKVIYREPIHMNVQMKGKLRRNQNIRLHQQINIQDYSGLMIIPISKTQEPWETTPRRNNKLWSNFFFRRNINRSLANSIPYDFEERNRTNTQETGSFRAIHTASPSDTMRGFPLRSVTPIKPFRRGIKTAKNSLNSDTIDLASINRRPATIRALDQPQIVTFEQIPLTSSKQTIDFVGKYNQQEVYEQFYKFKQTRSDRRQEGDGGVQGTKIAPFRKYQIREVQRLYPIRVKGDDADKPHFAIQKGAISDY